MTGQTIARTDIAAGPGTAYTTTGYDAIVIGARCAGAPVAMLLARAVRQPVAAGA